MKFILRIIPVYSCLLLVNGQNLLKAQSTFVKTFAGPFAEYATSVVRTFDGGFAFCGGSATSAVTLPNIRMAIGKTDSAGNLLWKKYYSINQLNSAVRIVQLPDSGFVVAGTSQPQNSNYQQDVYLIKVNAQGDSIWGQKIGMPGTQSEIAYDLMVTSDGHLVTVGTSAPSVINYLYITKVSPQGAIRYQRQVMGSWIGMSGMGIAESLDGGYLLAATQASPTRFNALVKTDTAGNVIWAKRWLRSGNKAALSNCVVQGADSSIFLAYTINYDPNNNLSDTWVAKCKPNGDTLKTWVYPNCVVGAILLHADGGFTISGQTPGYYSIGRLFRMGADGQTIQWQQTYPFFESPRLSDGALLPDGGYILGGGALIGNVNHIMLIKTDSTGNTPVPTKIATGKAGLKLNLYPNPAQSSFWIDGETTGLESVRLFDAMGRELRSWNGGGAYRMEFSLADLPKGMYRVEVQSSTGSSMLAVHKE